MHWMLFAVQIVMSATLFAAAAGKTLFPQPFTATLHFSRVPLQAAAPLGTLIPALEASIAFTLTLNSSHVLQIAFTAATVLLGLFSVWMLWVRWRGLQVRCSCFGTSATLVRTASLLRNLLLLLLTIAGIYLARHTSSPLPDLSVLLVVVVTSSGLLIALLLTLRAGLDGLSLIRDQTQAEEAV